jgi:hypothetical protein
MADSNSQPRPIKEGETFIVKGGKAYVGDERVTIPQLSYVQLNGGADGHWEMSLNDYLFPRGMAKSRSESGERPRNHVMMSAGILVDVEKQNCRVTVVQVYKPPVAKDCVVRCVEHFQHMPAAQVTDDTIITGDYHTLDEFGKSLSHAFGKPILVEKGVRVSQLVSNIGQAL